MKLCLEIEAIEGGNLTDESVKNFSDSIPSIKDLEIQQHLENLEKSNWIIQLEAANKIQKNLSNIMILAMTKADFHQHLQYFSLHHHRLIQTYCMT